MNTDLGTSVAYYLDLNNDFIAMHQFIDQTIKIEMTGYECLNCSSSEPIFAQGFCKKCFFESPNAGDWIIRPELSKAHLDIEDRDLAYEKKVQLQPHIVYLSVSSHIKVGVTRETQLPTRWIDQGAHQALAILKVPNRYLAGVGEVALKSYFSDKTNWRKMLQNEAERVDWISERNKAIDHLPNDLKQYIIQDNVEPLIISFPVNRYPEKVKSLNLKKKKSYTGVLKGIKGQYLIFEDDTVFNVRSNEGLVVNLEV